MTAQSPKFSHYLHLHFVVLILGFTGILGKLIETDAVTLVWYRMLVAFLGIFIFLLIMRVSLRCPAVKVARFLGVGLIVALHWITFFHSIKVSTVSVALGCFASTPLFTSFFEAWIKKRKVSLLEVGIGILIIIGLYIIFRFETRYVEGIVVGVSSAMLAALFTVVNEQLTVHHDARVMTLYEMMGGFIGITLYFLVTSPQQMMAFDLTPTDWIYLLILGVICTSYAFFAVIGLMRHLTAYSVTLAINLEPIYGILLAAWLFGEAEQMTSGFFVGTTILLIAVFSYPVLKRRFKSI